MKIDANNLSNIQPQNFENQPVAGAGNPGPVQTDQVEGFQPTNQSFESGAPAPTNLDLAGTSVLVGDRAQNFGLEVPNQPPADPSSSSCDGNWFTDSMDWIGQNILGNIPDPFSPLGDAAEWVAGGLADVSGSVGDGLKWFGENAWDGMKQIPGALEDGASFVKDAVVGGAEDIWDGGMWAANKLDEGVGDVTGAIVDGVSDVSNAVQDAAGAVGDAISDVCDW